MKLSNITKEEKRVQQKLKKKKINWMSPDHRMRSSHIH